MHKLDTLADMKVIPRYRSKTECPSCPACPGAIWTSEEGVKKLV